MKYFIVSDLHGINSDVLNEKLIDKGFNKENENHTLVVAGDICDGKGYDRILINFLMDLDKNNKLIAVKGNHDFGSDGVYYQHLNYMNDIFRYSELMPNNKEATKKLNEMWLRLKTYKLTEEDILKIGALTKKQLNWIKKLPYKFKNEDFNLAHGIYVKDNIFEDKKNEELFSAWGCPVLLSSNAENWWNVKKKYVNEFKKYYENSIDKYAASFNKPLFLGHFGKDRLKELLPEIQTDEDGFMHYKNIWWFDSSVIKGNDLLVKVWDFKSVE